MSRFAALAFATLVVATVGAFFVTQHLKVSTPLIAGGPAAVPGVINPNGPRCPVKLAHGRVLPNHRRMYISFYLLHRTDNVAVYIVDASGAIIRTIASGRHMRKGVRNPDGVFSWDGREDDGRIAPDGTYFIRVALLHQGRTVQLSNIAGRPVTVKVKTRPPVPRVIRVSPPLIPQAGQSKVTIDYAGTAHRSGFVEIFRTDLPGAPRLVKTFKTAWDRTQAVWDGLIDRRPAPQGSYLVGLKVADAACNTGRFPKTIPPAPGSTPHAGVTVHYLVAQPPLTPTPAGSLATVFVDARQRPYRWWLWRAGARKPSSAGAQHGVTVAVKMPPAKDAGLYHLVVRSGSHRTDVPLIADHPGTAHKPRILVILPALSWQGSNPVDGDGDGIPNTLGSGEQVPLARPLVNGLPGGWRDESALLSYLDRAHLRYDLTTDLGLIEGVGPALSGHTGAVLAGTEQWVPPSLGQSLRAFVQDGGRVLSLGIGSLLRGVTLRGGVATAPTAPASQDVLGAQPAPALRHGNELMTVIRDGLGIFSTTSGAFPGFSAFQVIRAVAPPGKILSAAGTTTSTPAIAGYRLGRGVVVDVGLVGFASRLPSSIDARELLGRLWAVLAR